jgi:hypothetical protein
MTPPTTPALPPGEIDRLFRKHGGWLEDDNGQCPAFWQMPMDNLFPFVREASLAALSAARSEKVEVRMLTHDELLELKAEHLGVWPPGPTSVQRKFAEVNNLKVKEQGNGN